MKALLGRKQIAAAFMATAVMITAAEANPRYPYNHYTANSNCFIGLRNHYSHGNGRLRLFYLQKCEWEKAAIIQKANSGK